MEILREVVASQLQTKPNFDELFFQQDGALPQYGLRVRDYLNKIFPQRWFGGRDSIEWPRRSPDLTPMDFFFGGVVQNKVYEKNPKTVNELNIRFMTHSEILMKIEICAALCVRVFWTGVKNVAMLAQNILNT